MVGQNNVTLICDFTIYTLIVMMTIVWQLQEGMLLRYERVWQNLHLIVMTPIATALKVFCQFVIITFIELNIHCRSLCTHLHSY